MSVSNWVNVDFSDRAVADDNLRMRASPELSICLVNLFKDKQSRS